MEKFNPKKESKETLPQPDLIIDFIRHGRSVYGESLKQKIRDIGQNPETFKLMPEINSEIDDPMEQLEGKITDKGQEELRNSAIKLTQLIDKKKEIIAILQGTRTRHSQSASIIINELEKKGIEILKQKEHEGLVDVKGGGWYTFVDYILKHQKKDTADLEKFWWEMYQNKATREDMSIKGYEHLEDISIRTEKVVELLRRFVRRFNLGKTLRVIAVTSDINIEQVQQKNVDIQNRDQIWVKNSDVLEIKIWNDKNDPNLFKEEMFKPLEVI